MICNLAGKIAQGRFSFYFTKDYTRLHKKVDLQFCSQRSLWKFAILSKKNCMLSSNTFSWLFIDVDIEVLNHIKFSYVLLLIILLLSMGVLMLKRLYSYCVIPNNWQWWPWIIGDGGSLLWSLTWREKIREEYVSSIMNMFASPP